MAIDNLLERYSIYVAKVTLLDPFTADKYNLYYRLFDIPLADKWAKEMIRLKRVSYRFREREIQFKNGKVDNTLVDKFNSIIKTINSFYDQSLPYIDKITENELNTLHEFYAIYGQRNKEKLDENYWDNAYKDIAEDDPRALIWPGISFNKEMHEAFLRLNDLIHKTEFSVNERLDPVNSGFIARVSYDPRLDIPLDDEDLPALKINLDFGDFCLGYNTLGKNLKHIVYDEDRASLEKGLIMPQETWSNEIHIHMKDSDNNPMEQYDYYRKWKKIKPEDFGFRYGDFFKNKEGYYCIGELETKQKIRIWDDNDKKIKIDLERFTEIYSVEIISNTQADLELKNRFGLIYDIFFKSFYVNLKIYFLNIVLVFLKRI